MLYDVLIRLWATVTLGILINAEGIAMETVAMSICVFLLLALSLLVKRKLQPLFLLSGYVASAVFIWEQGGEVWSRMLQVILSLGATLLMYGMYRKMTEYYEKLHKTRDDGEELERLLKKQNKQ